MKQINVTPTTYLVPIGKRGENKARQISFDISAFLNEGTGVFALLHQRNGDEKPYPVVTEVDGTNLIWIVTGYDTAIAGKGVCELRYTLLDDTETLIKSKRWQTLTEKSMAEPEDTGDFRSDWFASLVEQIMRELGELGIETTNYAYSMVDGAVYIRTIIDMDCPEFELDLSTGAVRVDYPDDWDGTTFEINNGYLEAIDE